MAKKKVGKSAKKVAKKVAKKGVKKAAKKMALGGAGHPDKRLPVSGDPDHEIVCKWIDDSTGYECRQVPTGGDWNP
jgi:hypothetical protein